MQKHNKLEANIAPSDDSNDKHVSNTTVTKCNNKLNSTCTTVTNIHVLNESDNYNNSGGNEVIKQEQVAKNIRNPYSICLSENNCDYNTIVKEDDLTQNKAVKDRRHSNLHSSITVSKCQIQMQNNPELLEKELKNRSVRAIASTESISENEVLFTHKICNETITVVKEMDGNKNNKGCIQFDVKRNFQENGVNNKVNNDNNVDPSTEVIYDSVNSYVDQNTKDNRDSDNTLIFNCNNKITCFKRLQRQ